MSMSTAAVTQTFDQLIREQLAIYAKELHHHFNEERRLRHELEERTRAVAIQEERDRIGRDLHDSIIQAIYGVGLNLERCTDIVSEAPAEVEEHLQVAIQGLNTVISNIRDYIMDLRPNLLGDRGLIEHLQALAEEFSKNGGIPLDLHLVLQEPPDLTDSQTIHLLAIAREGLTNVTKHAHASAIALGLSRDDDNLIVWVQDDGVGFASEESPSGRAQGLRNVKERAETLGGRLVIASSRGNGTRLEVILPLKSGSSTTAGA